jgi:hypothetical protein
VVNINSWEALIVMTVGSNHEQLISEESWFRNIWRGLSELLRLPHGRTDPPIIFHSNCVTVSLLLLPNSKGG